MRHIRTFPDEDKAREFAQVLAEAEPWSLIPADQIVVYEQKTLFAGGRVFQEGHWAVSWVQYTL